MRIHLRAEEPPLGAQHIHSTIFVNGQNCGRLCMDKDQYFWFYKCLEKGAALLSPVGLDPIEFVGSGSTRQDGEPVPPVPPHAK